MISVHTAGSSLVPQQPLNNIARGTLEALAGALGGCQSLDISCYDEPLSLPTENSSRVALATQYIIGTEAGACAVADPLGGSYFVEALTDGIEEKAVTLLKQIEEAGGMPEMIRTGKYQKALEAANYRKYSGIMNGSQPVIGVNHFQVPPEDDFQVPIHRNPPESAREHYESVVRMRRQRDNAKVRATLTELRRQAATKENLMPALIEATRAYATVGECVGVIRMAYGLSFDPFDMTQSPIQ
jgi:methylmalonyl-CoA mutase N-terminal domain/subunit